MTLVQTYAAYGLPNQEKRDDTGSTLLSQGSDKSF
jgi:hypothetical protein